MRKSKTVKLSEPFHIHDKTYSELVLREPTARMFLELGPLTQVYEVGRMTSQTDVPGVIESYIERCAVVDDPTVILPMLTALPLEDGVRLKREMQAFFGDAVATVLAQEHAAFEAMLASVGA